MNDDSMIKVMQSLGLNYSPAIESTLEFQKNLGNLDEQLETMKTNAIKSAKAINDAFSSQLGQMNGTTIKEINKMFAHIEKQSKPIELKVETDKAELKMQEFAKSMGIKLDKNLREQFKGLADSVMSGMDESKFNELAENISRVYDTAMQKQQKMAQTSAMANTDDMKIYQYMKETTLKLSESTISAKANVDGFSAALRNLTKQSDVSGSSLDQIAQEMESIYNIKDFGSAPDDIAERIKKAITNVREFQSGFKDMHNSVTSSDMGNFVKEELAEMIVSLGSIQHETKQTTASLDKMDDTRMDKLKADIKGLGVVTTETFKDMNNETYKYIDTYKNLEKGINISDTYLKNSSGKFDFAGRIVDDKSVEVTYKSIQKTHTEALKLNKAFDETLLKNKQMAQNDYWKKQFQNVADTSDEIKKLNKHYSKLEKQGKANIKNIQQSNLEQMKAQAATIQKRATSKDLSQEYVQQAATLREQLSVIQARLQTEGKLTSEEVKQTQELKEQLNILNSQSKTDANDQSRLNQSSPKNEFENKSSWFTDSAKFYAVSRAAKEATGTIKDVEMGMIEVARIMDDTSFVFDKYRDDLFKLGVDYGQTFDNVQAIALRWSQSGYNVVDSLELTKTSLLALNTAELDASNATESMIGIMSQWELKATDLALVMDKVNITADNYSVTSQDLVDGLLRSSGAAKVMGMSIDDTIATLTVLRETTGRTGAEVGNALNSILSYIQRPKSIDVMESLGIRMFADEAKTQFRDVMEVFDELSRKWQDPSISDGAKNALMAGAEEAGLFAEELAGATGMQEEFIEMTEKATEAQGQFNDIEKRDAAQAAAGVYRRNYFISLLEKFSNTQNVLNGLVDAGGYSLKENAATMETLEKKQQSLKTSVEQLAVAMGDAGLIGVLKSLADGGTDVINIINKMPEPMKDLVLATTATFTAVKTLEWGMKTFGIQIPGVSQMIGSLTSGTWSLTTALNAGATGVAAFVKANAPLLVISAAVGGIMAVTNALKSKREEEERAIEVFNQQKDVYSEIDSLIPIYENLSEKTSLTTDESNKLADAKQRIIDLLPDSKKFIDDESLSLQEQIGIIQDLNEAELNRLRIQAQKVVNDNSGTYEKDKQKLEELTALYKENNDELIRLSKIQLEIGKGNENVFLSSEEMEKLKVLPGFLEETGDKIEKLTEKTTAVDSAMEALSKMAGDDLTTSVDEFGNSADRAVGASDDLMNGLDGVAVSAGDVDEAFLNADGTINHYAYSISKAYEAMKETQAETMILEAALDELRETGHLTTGTYEQLTDASLDFINIMGMEKGEAENLLFTRINLNNKTIDGVIAEQSAVVQATRAKIDAYSAEIGALSALAAAKAAAGQMSGAGIMTSLPVGSGNGPNAGRPLLFDDGSGRVAVPSKSQMSGAFAGAIAGLEAEVKKQEAILNSYKGFKTAGVNASKVAAGGRADKKAAANKKNAGGGSKKKSDADKKKEAAAKKAKSDAEKKLKKAKADAEKAEKERVKPDRYRVINQELEKSNNLLAKNKILQESVKDDVVAKIKLMKEQVKLEQNEEKLLKKKADLHRVEREEIKKKLAAQGFKFQGSGDSQSISNLNNVNGKSKEVGELFDRYNELQFSTIPKLETDRLNINNSINDSISKGVVQQTILNNKVIENNHLLSMNAVYRERASHDFKETIKLQEDEIKLLEEKEKLQKGQADIARSERAELEKALRNEGFKFEGKGDFQIITNPQDIKGKLQVIQDALDKYNNIQLEVIPNIKVDREQIKNEMDKIKSEILSTMVSESDDYISSIDRSQERQHANMNIVQRKDDPYWSNQSLGNMVKSEKSKSTHLYDKAWEFINKRDTFDKVKEAEQWKEADRLAHEYFMRYEESQLKVYELETERHESAMSHINKELEANKEAQDEIQYHIDMLEEDDLEGKLKLSKELANEEVKNNVMLKRETARLQQELNEALPNTNEWHILSESVKNYNKQLQDSNLELKRMKEQTISIAKEQAQLSFDKTLKEMEKSIFGGQTEDEVREAFEQKLYLEGKYIEGLEKELQISKIRKYVEQEKLNLTKEQQDILNSNGKIERATLERMNKQLEIQQLQNRLANLKNQKTIQSIVKKDDGTFDFEYVADQDAIYQTEQELADKKADLIRWEKDYQNEQERKSIEDKSKYLSKINNMLKEALEGDYKTIEEFYEALEKLNTKFIGNIDDESFLNTWVEMMGGISPLIDEFGETFDIFLEESNKSFDDYVDKSKKKTKELKDELETDTESTHKVNLEAPEPFTMADSSSTHTVYVNTVYSNPNKGSNVLGVSNEDVKNSNTKTIKGFATGGETQNTGWHWLDGKNSEPERVLSTQQTKDFNKFTTYIPDLLKNMAKLSVSAPILSVPDILKTQFNSGKATNVSTPRPQQIIHNHIGKVEFPNVRDAKEIEESILGLERIIIQNG